MVSNIDLKINYTELFGEKWLETLNEIIFSEDFYRVMLELHLLYKKKSIHPKKHDVFKAFKLCDPDNLKVVIVGEEPYSTNLATGIPYGINENSIKIPKALNNIKECVENEFYNGLALDFDYTLESWADQGVLMLSRSLTIEDNKPGSHYYLWNYIIINIIRELNLQNAGIVFMLWGSSARSLGALIDQNFNHVMEFMSPADTRYSNLKWNCNHFKITNQLLEENFGHQSSIIW